jgi:SAM-dependent methyltransferase
MSFDDKYFSSHTYQGISFARFSQYWLSNRFYAILSRRYGSRGSRLLEIGSGLGHLVGQLEDKFETVATDVNPWALQKSQGVACRTFHLASSAENLPFKDAVFNFVIIKHVIEHLVHPEKGVAELGRVMAPGGTLIMATPNLASLLKPWKGDQWIGYQDPTHISLKPPEEWLDMLRNTGFSIIKIFSDGFWDVPYIKVVPKTLQKLFFGSLGGVQAILGIPFLPMRWGESIMVVARKVSTENPR